MPGAVEFKGIEVKGLRELRRAFAVADKTLSVELREALKEAGEPVRLDAQQLAVENITRVGFKWSRMRVGITRSLVYVAPQQRGRLTRRNPQRYARGEQFATLLMKEAMEPALDANIGEVERLMEDVLATVGKAWERA